MEEACVPLLRLGDRVQIAWVLGRQLPFRIGEFTFYTAPEPCAIEMCIDVSQLDSERLFRVLRILGYSIDKLTEVLMRIDEFIEKQRPANRVFLAGDHKDSGFAIARISLGKITICVGFPDQ